MDLNPDEEEMEGVILEEEIERHWKMVFEDNDGGVVDQKAILHAKMWYLYTNEKKALIKGGYYVEVSGSDRKKVLWGVIDYHVLEE